eukprot:COSAG05_NODE_94_length_19565_cov_15.870133_9_plen_88_part_00
MVGPHILHSSCLERQRKAVQSAQWGYAIAPKISSCVFPRNGFDDDIVWPLTCVVSTLDNGDRRDSSSHRLRATAAMLDMHLLRASQA